MGGWVKSTFITAILIQVINNVVAQFIKLSASYCFFATVGDRNYNIIWKTILAYFLNTTFAAYLVKMGDFQGENKSYSAIWGKAGLT